MKNKKTKKDDLHTQPKDIEKDFEAAQQTQFKFIFVDYYEPTKETKIKEKFSTQLFSWNIKNILKKSNAKDISKKTFFKEIEIKIRLSYTFEKNLKIFKETCDINDYGIQWNFVEKLIFHWTIYTKKYNKINEIKELLND